MARFSICLGTYQLTNFAELQLRSLRSIFGSAPILIYDGKSKHSPEIKELADRFDAIYLTENVNRTHWMGDMQNVVASIAFARANNCQISLKINQRFLLCSETIPDLIEGVFDDPSVDLALPSAIRVETIPDERSRFHARFPIQVDLIATRANAVAPEQIAEAYARGVEQGTCRNDALVEAFWPRMTENEFKGRWKTMPFLSEPQDPPLYLRKAQSTEEMYQAQAVRLGMSISEFPVQEWATMLGSAYRPLQAFA